MELSNHAFFRSEEGGAGGKPETSVEKGGAKREKEGEVEKKEQVHEAHEGEESRGKSEEEGGAGVHGEKEHEVSEDGKTDTDSIIENEARCLVDEANLELSRRKSALANQ
jgi:hypothetical protein